MHSRSTIRSNNVGFDLTRVRQVSPSPVEEDAGITLHKIFGDEYIGARQI